MDRYFNIQKLLNDKNQQYIGTTLYPIIPESVDDIFVLSSDGDRLDRYAFRFYKDSTLWWIISANNPDVARDSVYLQGGIQIRIPAIPVGYLTRFNNYNK
jgi:phage tail protein X